MTGVLVLAAGGSSRMGRPKQLLHYQGKTLLRHAVDTALATRLGPVLVVLGAEAARCLEALGELEIRSAVNPHWEQGIGSSISVGMAALERLVPDIAGVLILLHDQPAIPAERLSQLVAARQENDLVVASICEGITDVPAYFRRELFVELRQLSGVNGAKKVMQAHPGQVRRFDLPEAKFDIDTPEDYQRVCGTQKLRID